MSDSPIVQIIAANTTDIPDQFVKVDLERLLKAYRATKRTPLQSAAFRWLSIRKEPLRISDNKVLHAPQALAESINDLVESMLALPVPVVTPERVRAEIDELF